MSYSSKLTTETLHNRLLRFSQNCQNLVSKLLKTQYNLIYGDQLIRSSASPGANYIEAVEASSRKEFVLKLKICRRETKESIYWLTLIESSNSENLDVKSKCEELISEGKELIKIFASSIITCERNNEINKIRK